MSWFSVTDTPRSTSPAVLFKWSRDSERIAICGAPRIVKILDKEGKKECEFALPSLSGPKKDDSCFALDWDRDGERLAVAQRNANFVFVLSTKTNTVATVELKKKGMKDVSCICWNRLSESLLAIGLTDATV